MRKPPKSQWEFGELFPPAQPSPPAQPPPRKVLTVADLTVQIRRLLESQVGQVWVTGEITNLRFQSSGHAYFTLKDPEAQLSCVLFRGESQVNRDLLQDGRKVTLQGQLTVYEPRGQYQLRVTAAELQGIGALQVAFEQLKQKLKAEGLFAPERKRSIPRYPQRIGLVTSPTGAAIRDVLHVIQRRNPGLEIVLVPCRVQGDGAAREIAEAIRLLNDFNGRMSKRNPIPWLDLILITRGGGSIEDLWAFNEEVVARAIFESAVPLVSAVGHEIDFTISDFVADLRAATPSAAAELITEGVFSSLQFLAAAAERLGILARQHVAAKRGLVEHVCHRFQLVHPRRRLEQHQQHLDDLHSDLTRCARQAIRDRRTAWENLRDRLGRVRPSLLLERRREKARDLSRRLREQLRRELKDHRACAAALETRLRLLGPEQVLARGYSITSDDHTGRILRDASAAQPGQRLRTRLSKGEIVSRVEPAS